MKPATKGRKPEAANEFTEAIFRALDTANVLQREGLEALFPDLYEVWCLARCGATSKELEQIGGAR